MSRRNRKSPGNRRDPLKVSETKDNVFEVHPTRTRVYVRGERKDVVHVQIS